jgi:SHS2 domain-containing protein
MFNDIVFGFAKGLYDLFGEAALATVDTIGEDILEDMEHELGLEIQGETPEDILTEIERLLVDEYGMCKSARLEIEDHEIDMICEGCLLWRATLDLQEAGVPPYTCVPMMMASAALHKRLGKKARFVSIEQDMDKRICDIDFHLPD